MMTETDIDQLLQSIHSALASPDSIDFDLLRDDVVAYNDLCFDLNLKLTAVGRLIDQGLRDDAIEMSDRDGNLLTLFESLDFPERELWCDLVDAMELPRPPDLDVDAATKLNMAYAVLDDLGTLLQNHRMLALGRGPLVHRIRLLNALATRDPENPIWETDATAFQKVRLKKLSAELDEAIRVDDLQKLRELNDELTASKWWIPVPPKMIAQIRTGLGAGRRREVLAEIQIQSNSLQRAYQTEDFAAAAPLVETIGTLAAEANLELDDPIMDPIQPAIAWVNDCYALQDQARSDQQIVNRLSAISDQIASVHLLDGVKSRRQCRTKRNVN